jgi:hypothetical protein
MKIIAFAGFLLSSLATQQYNCVVIPEFQSDGLLPSGVHTATWQEVCQRFGWNEHRRKLLEGLRLALCGLRAAGCQRAYLDGSFVTSKEFPGDFDGLWEVAGVNPQLLDPVLLDFRGLRAAQKAKYLGEMFPVIPGNPIVAGQAWLDFFQTDKASGNPKGIVMIDIGSATL